MNIRRATACFFLFAATAAAAPPTDLAKLLADAPADALAVVYVQQPADLLTHRLLHCTLEHETSRPVAEALQALAKLLDGPAAVVVTGSPLRPDLLGVTITAKVSTDADTFFKALDLELLAALNRIEAVPGSGAIGFDRAGESATVRIPGPVPIHLAIVVHDGYLSAHSNHASVERRLSPPDGTAGDPHETFVESEDFKRLVPKTDRPPDLLLYVNCRPLMPMAKLALRHVPEVHDIFGLEQVEAVGLTAAWSDRQTKADLTVCLAGEPEGLMQLFRSAARPVNVGKVFPPDAVFVLGGAFPSGAALADRVNEVLDLVDPEIVEEYEQERVEFARDYGFDIHTDFLGNLTDEWAVAVRAHAGLPVFMLAVGLDDPSAFGHHVSALAGAFDLKFNVTTYGEVTIFSPLSARFNVAYGVVDRYLVVARDTTAVCGMVDAWHDGKSLDQTPGYHAAAKRFTRGASAFAYLDVAHLIRLALQNDEIEVNPAAGLDEELVEGIERLASGRASASMALRSTPGGLRLSLDYRSDGQSGLSAGDVIWSSVGASLARSRELSRRMVSASNLAGIVKASMVYADRHEGEWPASLAELVRGGDLSLKTLGDVYNGTAPRTFADAERESYYLYRKNVPKNIAPTEVVAGEREIRGGEGANFAFADGHVQFVREPDASRLLAALRAQSQ